MWFRVASLCVLAALLWPASATAQERRRPAELTVAEITAQRDGDVIQIDGRVENIGQRRAGRIKLIVHVLGPGRQPLETREGPLDQDDVEPGEDALFSLETPCPPRAIEIRLEARDSTGRIVTLRRAGPHPIQ
jgi:hypothetical protein